MDLAQTEHRFAASRSGGAEQACGSQAVAALERGSAQTVSAVFVVEEEHHPLGRCRIPATPSRLDRCGEVFGDQSPQFAVDGIAGAGVVGSCGCHRVVVVRRVFGRWVVDEEVEGQCHPMT